MKQLKDSECDPLFCCSRRGTYGNPVLRQWHRSEDLLCHQGSCILPCSLLLWGHFSVKSLLFFFELLHIFMTYYPHPERLRRATEQSRVPSVYFSRSAFPCWDVRHSSALLWFCSSYLPSPSLTLFPLSPSGSEHGRCGVEARGNCSNWNRKRVSSKRLCSVLLNVGPNILLYLLKNVHKKSQGIIGVLLFLQKNNNNLFNAFAVLEYIVLLVILRSLIP